METLTETLIDWKRTTESLSKTFAERAKKYDREGAFVFENYKDLKEHKFFSAAIPEELGGGGISHAEMCDLLRIIARSCASTALALSMHQHLVAAAIWRFKHKGESRPLLEKIAKDQTILISTGARDWLESNGELKKTEGGYLLTAKKAFASQSEGGDIIVTSAPVTDEAGKKKVLHFAVPMKAEGVSLLDDWDTMSMRGTGSQTVAFSDVFVPDGAVTLVRDAGYHPVFDVVCAVAVPLIMSVYVGIAERAMEIAIETGRNYPRNRNHLPYIIGKMNNTLTAARSQWYAMHLLTNNLDFSPAVNTTVQMASLKSNVADACMQTVHQAMEAIGGQSIYKRNELERLFRDVQASQFHPMPLWDQYLFAGEFLLTEKQLAN